MPKMMATIQMSRERWKWQLPSRPRSAAAAIPPGRAVRLGRAAAAMAGLRGAVPAPGGRGGGLALPWAGTALGLRGPGTACPGLRGARCEGVSVLRLAPTSPEWGRVAGKRPSGERPGALVDAG